MCARCRKPAYDGRDRSGVGDGVTYKPGAHRKFQRVVPGVAGLDHVVIDGAGHFIQEDARDRLVEIIDTFVHGGMRA